jgi:16S rRNA (uracil1498-N3)-methyltransferase
MGYNRRMRLHRFFLDIDLTRSPVTVGDADVCHQMHRVLRLEAGNSVIVADGRGAEAQARIAKIDAKTVTLEFGAPRPVAAEPARAVTLFCAVLKRENMEWVIQKATEAGAKHIVPVLTGRTVKTGVKTDRLLKIAREAAEQSGRGAVPTVAEPVPFERALELAPPRNIFLDFGGDERWSEQLRAESIGCWVGPEGGWTDEERAAAKQAGFVIGSLGALTLRAETAAVVATYLAVHGR